MRISDFDYNLPKELIAQEPIKPRDHSRLLIMDKKTGKLEHKHFYDIVDYLHAGDVLVLNNSKVFPARLIGRKKETGGKIEVFLHKHEGGAVWQCLVGGRGARVGLAVEFGKKLSGEIVKNNNDGTWEVKFNKSGEAMMKIINQIGKVPLPPYVKREDSDKKSDIINYQTVYAEKVGSVAAPTAGFHFTPQLLKKIKAKGVRVEYITLHVGLGTFAPVKVDDITKHQMHAEWVEVKSNVIRDIVKAKMEGRRVITVGTTSTRTLESIFAKLKIENLLKIRKLKIENFSGWTDIFIFPGYKFKVVDALITNFHLPKSTLLMLVSAFANASADKSAYAGRNKIFKAYKEAIEKRYRFFSYGDAMFIYND